MLLRVSKQERKLKQEVEKEADRLKKEIQDLNDGTKSDRSLPSVIQIGGNHADRRSVTSAVSSQRSQKVKTPVNLTRKEQLGSLTPNYKPKSKLDLERERLTKQLKGVDKVLEV